MKLEGLKDMLAKPGCKKSNLQLAKQLLYGNQIDSEVQNPKPEPVVRNEPLGPNEGKKESAKRTIIRVTSFRNRLCDPDNLCVKALVDSLRYCGLIKDDRPEDIELVVAQQKCPRKEERTEIVISYP